MGYKVIADRHQMDEMREKYGPRRGLEGPFNFTGRVLYYDPVKVSIMTLKQISMWNKRKWTRSINA